MKAFTLVELIVVITILSILFTVAFIAFNDGRNSKTEDINCVLEHWEEIREYYDNCYELTDQAWRTCRELAKEKYGCLKTDNEIYINN